MFLSIILISLHVQVAFWQLLINEHDDDDDARTARGGVPATPNFGGSLQCMRTPCRWTTKFDVVTHVEMGDF